MPQLVAAAVDEMWNSANMAFELCPMLTSGAMEAIERNGSDALKRVYLPKMVTGEWTGTMNLTEPQAGSDLAAVRTKAVPQGDGSYQLHGNKIFITYGEHDYTDNIVHLVLARTPDAPPGVKGISLFVVPKFLVNADGTLGERNDMRCVSLEHKLGIHASPTAVLAFGDKGGAVGDLVGEENRGLDYMFVMMNQARFGVGMQGVGIAERAYQRARDYARERVQGRVAGAAREPRGGIIGHPDVRRMLLTMRAATEASRALGYVTAAALDFAHRHPDAERARARARVRRADDSGRQGLEHGSRPAHGLPRRAGARRHGVHRGDRGSAVRSATRASRRSTKARPASRPTTSSAARSGATAALRCSTRSREARRADRRARSHRDGISPSSARDCDAGVDALEGAGRARRDAAQRHARRARRRGPDARACGHRVRRRAARAAPRSSPSQMLAEGDGDADFLRAKIVTARHFADHFLDQASGLRETVVDGSSAALALAEAQF